jgi:hypothetical protein
MTKAVEIVTSTAGISRGRALSPCFNVVFSDFLFRVQLEKKRTSSQKKRFQAGSCGKIA